MVHIVCGRQMVCLTGQCSIWGTVIVRRKPRLFGFPRTFEGEHHCVISLFHITSLTHLSSNKIYLLYQTICQPSQRSHDSNL